MKLMKKLRPFLVLLLILSFVSVSVASPGKYARLNEGEVLPWDGWCFDGNAMAEIVADKELEQFEKLQMEFEKLKDWKEGAQKVIWLIATAAGGMWVKHFMDLMMR